MNKYRFLTPAEKEMLEAALHYDEVSNGLGSQFLDEMESILELLCGYPEIGTTLTSGLRGLTLSRFPFKIVYAVDSGTVLVVAVAHHSRRPGYWQGRI